RRILLVQEADLVAVYTQTGAGRLDLAGKRPVVGVVLAQMGERLRIADVVGGPPLDVGTLLVGGTEHVTANAAEAVDPDAYRHPHTSFVDSKETPTIRRQGRN